MIVWIIILTFVVHLFDAREIPKNVFDDVLKILPGITQPSHSGACTININKDLVSPEPLLMTHNIEAQKRQFLQPINNTKGLIHLRSGQQIELHCSHGFKSNFNGTSLVARCLDGTTFVINYEKTQLNQISCNRNTFHTTKVIGECKKNGTLIQIGYEISSTVPDVNNNVEQSFHKLITVCACKISDRTYWSHTTLTKANAGSQNGVTRPSFLSGRGHFTSKDVNRLYSKNNQLNQLSAILGTERTNVLITDRQALNRGHLTPKADMIMGTHQRATFYFVNVAPQWASFNSGNWAKIEEAVRRVVAERDMNVDVYTGTYGVVKFDVNGTQSEFYLNFDENGNGLLPVPKIYYKVIIDKESTKGVALIGVNNPYLTLTELKRDYIICEDVSGRIKWVSNIQQQIQAGYYYACNVNDLLTIIDTLPKFNITELLI